MTDIAKRAVLGDVTNVASPVRIVKPTAPEKGSDGAPRPAGVSSEVVAAINAKIAELKHAGAIKIPVVEGAVSDQTSNATVKPLKPLDGTGRKDAPVDEKWAAVVQAINDACAELKQAGILMIAPTAITLSDAKLGEGGNGTVCVGQVCLPDKTCDFAVKLLAATGSKDAKSTLRVALHALPFLFGRQLATGTPGPSPSVRSSLRECVLNLTRWNACFPHSPQGTFETSC